MAAARAAGPPQPHAARGVRRCTSRAARSPPPTPAPDAAPGWGGATPGGSRKWQSRLHASPGSGKEPSRAEGGAPRAGAEWGCTEAEGRPREGPRPEEATALRRQTAEAQRRFLKKGRGVPHVETLWSLCASPALGKEPRGLQAGRPAMPGRSLPAPWPSLPNKPPAPQHAPSSGPVFVKGL